MSLREKVPHQCRPVMSHSYDSVLLCTAPVRTSSLTRGAGPTSKAHSTVGRQATTQWHWQSRPQAACSPWGQGQLPPSPWPVHTGGLFHLGSSVSLCTTLHRHQGRTWQLLAGCHPGLSAPDRELPGRQGGPSRVGQLAAPAGRLLCSMLPAAPGCGESPWLWFSHILKAFGKCILLN